MRSISIGNFDGVHLGHVKLIEAASKHGEASIVTFDPHPREALNPGVKVPKLMSLEDRITHLKKSGANDVFILPFNETFAQTTARGFFEDYIIGKWDASHVSVGPNFYFGNDRKGNPEMLKKWMEELGRHAHIIEPYKMNDGTMVSSSAIRKVLSEGNTSVAQMMLGRPHYIKGIVSSGFKRGKKIGFATANLYPHIGETQYCAPLEGVYATCVEEKDGTRHEAITNVGFRPTMPDHSPLSVETHIFDFDRDLYGDLISVYFLDRIREEKKFHSIEELKSQIFKDIKVSRKIHQKKTS